MNIRLSAFDAFIGKPLGLKVLAQEMGWWKALRLGIELEVYLKKNPPFEEINKTEKLTSQKESSQQQMAPVVGMYRLLLQKKFSQEEALQIVDKLVSRVAFQFLQYNIPVIQKDKIKNLSKNEKLNIFKKLSNRFFNAEALISVPSEDEIIFDVQFCHFAYYCNKLGLSELGPIFCKADKLYFEQKQPHINFQRTQTLAEGATSCDFKFQIRE